MGIVLQQSFRNTVVTFIGFGIGAINTLFLYTNIMKPEYYGLVTYILASGALLMPLMAFGTHNTLVRFYHSHADPQKDGFLTLMLISPLLVLVPLGIFTWLFTDRIAAFLSTKNPLVREYVWYVFLIGAAMAYFEVFYAWARVQLKSVFGNFMKEVFARLGAFVLLVLLYFEVISLSFFFMALVVVYILRALIMKLYVLKNQGIRLNFSFPKNTGPILRYGFLIILGGSASTVLLEVDKVMIGQYKILDNVAFYSVSGFIASVIIVPSRAMHQITYPLTAKLLSENKMGELLDLYRKSSLSLLMVSGLLFLLIVINLEELYLLVPNDYRNGLAIVFLLGLAKVFDSLLGNNNSILYNSKYYKTILALGVFLAATTILLNLWLIPLLGINGAALASFLAIGLYNSLKLFIVKKKFGMLPFQRDTWKAMALLLFLGLLFSQFNLTFHPIFNVVLKSIAMVLLYLAALYRLKISKELHGYLSKLLRRK